MPRRGWIRRGTCIYFAAAAAAAATMGATARGAGLWTGDGNDLNYPAADWNDANNWDGAVIPADGDDVIFATGFESGYQINPGNPSTIFVTGAGSTWQLAYQSDLGGSAGPGQLIVQDGGAVRGPTSAGDDQTSLFLGNAPTGGGGSGTLMVQNGGTVSDLHGAIAVNVASTATVSGAGSVWNNKEQLDLGGFFGFGAGAGAGTLNINNFGVVTSGGQTHLWNAASSINIDHGSLVTKGLGGVGTITLSDFGPGGDAALTVGGLDSVYDGTISGPGTLRKVGNSAQILTASNTGIGTARVEGGVLLVQGNLSASGVSTASPGILSIAPGGARMLHATFLDEASTGQIDLHDNKMIVTATPIGTYLPFSQKYNGVTGMVASAYHFGAWDGPGITTSMSGAAGGLTTLAVATASQVGKSSFGGQSVGGNDVLVMYTYAGDANLDGAIDGGDYGIIDNFVQIPGASGYANGDFNYDGVIDGGDYGIIDNNVQAQGAPFPLSGLIEPATLSGVTVVPEPCACGFAVVIAGAVGFFGRRQRRGNRG